MDIAVDAIPNDHKLTIYSSLVLSFKWLFILHSLSLCLSLFVRHSCFSSCCTSRPVLHSFAFQEYVAQCVACTIDCDAHFICMLSIFIKFLPMWMWMSCCLYCSVSMGLCTAAAVAAATQLNNTRTHLPAFELVKQSAFCFYLFILFFWWPRISFGLQQ